MADFKSFQTDRILLSSKSKSQLFKFLSSRTLVIENCPCSPMLGMLDCLLSIFVKTNCELAISYLVSVLIQTNWRSWEHRQIDNFHCLMWHLIHILWGTGVDLSLSPPPVASLPFTSFSLHLLVPLEWSCLVYSLHIQ